jgi:AraC-like DNA-binding protein
MDRFDRLTTLIDRFKLTVAAATLDQATLLILGDHEGTPERVLFLPTGKSAAINEENVLFAAHVDWNGASNPLVAALPPRIEIDLGQDRDTIGLIRLMLAEMDAQRCGMGSVLNRLGEVLIVRILREQIETGSTHPGLLAGLSDPRLSRAIVAMHDQPGHNWRNEDLAQAAGLSLSRFAEVFLERVGETPAAYLRRWRLVLARQDITKGHRIDAVARRYGFSSPEGFTRAFKKRYGTTPISQRV